MQIPVIKKLVELYSISQLKEAEDALLNEQKPSIEVDGKDEGECLTHVLASIYIKEHIEKNNSSFNLALRDFTQRVRKSIS